MYHLPCPNTFLTLTHIGIVNFTFYNVGFNSLQQRQITPSFSRRDGLIQDSRFEYLVPEIQSDLPHMWFTEVRKVQMRSLS